MLLVSKGLMNAYADGGMFTTQIDTAIVLAVSKLVIQE
jgi:hypothetical protein